MNRPETNDDLAWTAARYVLGELSAEDASRFEALLADDHSAREAVAEAVLLMEGVIAAQPFEATQKRRKVAAWFGAAVAVCALVAVVKLFAPVGVEKSTGPVLVKADDRDNWMLDLADLLEEQMIAADAAAADVEEDVVPIAMEADDDEIPGWLILATSRETDS